MNYFVDLTSPTRSATAVLAVLEQLTMKHPQAIVRLAGAVILPGQVRLTVAVNLADPERTPRRNKDVGAAGTAYLADLLDNMHQHHPRNGPAPSSDARKNAKEIRECLRQALKPQTPPLPSHNGGTAAYA